MTRIFLFLIVLVIAGLPSLALTDVWRGVEALSRLDFATAFREFNSSAQEGDAYSQFFLGSMYEEGQGVPKNDAEAVRWYRRAAEQGVAEAQSNLGLIYAEGRGVPKNDAEAVRWFRRAAEQGHVVAQFNLALMYRDGRGVPKNDAEAVRWYRRAAEQGDADAQLNLGFMYAEGRGVPRNLVQSYLWASLAAAQGNETARRNLEISERQMTREQIAEAQRLAAAFRPRAETAGSSSVTSTPAQPPARTAPPPAQTATIRNIQRHLSALGYDPGPADGIMGPRTARAIQAFQRDLGIEPDGIASTTLEAFLVALVEEINQEESTPPQLVEARLISTGSGFFVSPQGHVLTNHHVIEDCGTIRVSLPQGATPVRVVAMNAEDDLAVLQADMKPAAVASFRRRAAALGEDISVAGYPLRGLLSGMNLTTGTVSSTSGLRGDARYFQITAPVQAGNSGGPMLDSSGAVVGVVVAKLDAVSVARATGDLPQNVNFAIKAALVRSFLSIHDVPYSETTNERPKQRAAIANEAQRHTVLVECLQ